MDIVLQRFRIELNNLISDYRERGISAYLLSGIVAQEMLKLKEAMQTVDEARTLCGGDSLRQEIFFTSSTQRAEEWDCVVIFGKDGIYAPSKWTAGGNSQTVCAIREFD